MLADSSGKAFLSEIRSKAKDSFLGHVPDGQFGSGANFGSTSSASALARSMICSGLLNGFCVVQ
eukprot:11360226-Karenia_brevis.AAC.1